MTVSIETKRKQKREWYWRNRESQLQYKKENRHLFKKYEPTTEQLESYSLKVISRYSKEFELTPKKYRYALMFWSKIIKNRDNNKCQICGNKGQIAHHILHKAKYPKLSLNINNGITLCRWCHAGVHEWTSIR